MRRWLTTPRRSLARFALRRRSPSGGTTWSRPPRFADQLTNGIKSSELYIFENCSHAPLYENVAAFNEKTLAFLKTHAG